MDSIGEAMPGFLDGDRFITPTSQGIYTDQENPSQFAESGPLVYLNQGPGSPIPSGPQEQFHLSQDAPSSYPNYQPDGLQQVQDPNARSPPSLDSFLANGGLQEYDMHRGNAQPVFRYMSPLRLGSPYPEAPLLNGLNDYPADQGENAYQAQYTSVGFVHGHNQLNPVHPSATMYPAGAPSPYVGNDDTQPGEFEHCYDFDHDDSQSDYTMPPATTQKEDGGNAKKKIPLVCTVCPNKPHFSDNSHLLTHINSKGHLHAHQQLKIRALKDVSASDLLAEYHEWYQEHDVEGLLSQRLAQRDLKEATRKRRASAAATRPEKKPKNAKMSKTTKGENAIKKEPLLKMEKGVKMEEGSEPAKKILGIRQRPQTPISFASGVTSMGFQTPVRNHHDDLLPRGPAPTRSKVDAGDMDSVIEDSDFELKGVRDNVRLKGAFWPGMNLFDAASPEMKRMRNQRKNDALVQQMKAASEAVLPSESVYNLEFQLERKRSVFDSPSVDESMTPKKPPKKRGRKPISSIVEEEDEYNEENEENDGTEETEGTVSNSQVQVKFEPGGLAGPVTRSRAAGIENLNDAMLPNRPPSGGPHVDRSFPVRRRLPLHPLGPNAALASPTPPSKHRPSRLFGTGKENQSSEYRLPQPIDSGPFFVPRDGGARSGLAGLNNNPLCFPAADFHFNPFLQNAFRPEVSVAPFRPINSMSHQMMFNHYLSTQHDHGGLVDPSDEDAFF